MNEGIIPVQDNDVLRGNVNAQLLSLYEMKDQFALLMSSAETSLNKLELAIRYSKTDSMPYISYHQQLCEKLKYALELREKLEDFIENAEQHAIFAGIYRGFEYPQALEYIKDVVNPYWREVDPNVIIDESYLFEEERDFDDVYWGDLWTDEDLAAWNDYGDDYYEEESPTIVQSWYETEDPWKAAYEPQDDVSKITWEYLKQSELANEPISGFVAPRHRFVTKEGTINILDHDENDPNICDLIRYNAVQRAQDKKFNFGVPAEQKGIIDRTENQVNYKIDDII